jgi:hypothetical protein
MPCSLAPSTGAMTARDPVATRMFPACNAIDMSMHSMRMPAHGEWQQHACTRGGVGGAIDKLVCQDLRNLEERVPLTITCSPRKCSTIRDDWWSYLVSFPIHSHCMGILDFAPSSNESNSCIIQHVQIDVAQALRLLPLVGHQLLEVQKRSAIHLPPSQRNPVSRANRVSSTQPTTPRL